MSAPPTRALSYDCNREHHSFCSGLRRTGKRGSGGLAIFARCQCSCHRASQTQSERADKPGGGPARDTT